MTKNIIHATVITATVFTLSACGVSPENPPTDGEHIPFSQRVTETINPITVTPTTTPEKDG